MAINTLATATLFQKTLDKAAVREAVTGWMDGNAGQVKYSGGAEIKIPKMSVQGLADYESTHTVFLKLQQKQLPQRKRA